MAKVQNFEDLEVWKNAHALCLEIYKLTKQFPREEQYGLVSQMRRAAVSIESNIAEGFGRFQAKDKDHFYVMASGSLSELLSQIILSRDLGYVTPDEHDVLRARQLVTKKLLLGLIRAHRT